MRTASLTCQIAVLTILLVTGVVYPSFILAEQQAIDSITNPEFGNILETVSEYTIAVLPMENLTVERDIAYHFRSRLHERLRSLGYTVVDNQRLDMKLHEIGVNHAGQLQLVSFAQLQQITSADAFLSGVVEQGTVQHAGVLNSYVFTCSLKLQDRNMKVLWSALQNRVAKRRFSVDPINMFLDIVLTEAGGKLQDAVYALADTMLSGMPEGPATIVSRKDPLLDMAILVKAREE